MPGCGHRGGHHAAGKGTKASLLCPSVGMGQDGGKVHRQASSCPVGPQTRKGFEQAEQCPPGGIAVLAHAWAFSPGVGAGGGQ